MAKNGKPKIEIRDKIKMVPLSDLKPYEKNARTHSKEQIAQVAASIKEFGFTNPVLIDKSGGIVAGHCRALAAASLGMNEVPTITLSDLTPTQVRAYIIADNKLALNAGWDEELLGAELLDLKSEGFDISLTGFDDDELAKLLDDDKDEKDGDDEPKFEPHIFDAKQIVGAAFAHFREAGFPYHKHPLFWCMQELNKLAGLQDQQLLNSTRGYQIADTFHPHRFHATAVGKRSPVDLFDDDKGFRVALEKQLDMHGSIPDGYFSMLGLASNTQACSNFRPGFACYLYREFCDDGGTILDTSTGYGGRLVGFMASKLDGYYIGIDPNTITHKSNTLMAEAMGFKDRVRLINKPAEDVQEREIKSGSVDFAFTSPPYFAKEIYSDEPTQSRERYKTFEEWRDGFLLKTLALTHRVLKKGKHCAINIADVRIKSKEYPLVQATRECAEKVGLKVVEERQFDLGGRMGVDLEEFPAYEPVIIMVKP